MSGEKKGIAERAYELALQEAKTLELEIWDVIFVKEGADYYLRIFIDHPQAVNIDHCVEMTRKMNPILDEKDFINHEYIFEVSSPGINRKLTKATHFEKYTGERIRVKMIRPLENGERTFDATLLSSENHRRIRVRRDDLTEIEIEVQNCASVSAIDAGYEDF